MISDKWFLISDGDVSAIAERLREISDDDTLPIAVRQSAMTALHLLDTGTHETNEIPGDFKTQ